MDKWRARRFASGIAIVAMLLVMAVWPGGGAKAGTGAWTVVGSPNPGPNNLLRAVSAYNPTHVWAVGYYDDGGGFFRTLIMHYNTNVSPAVWVQDSSPNLQGVGDNRLWGVSARAVNDVWAVGDFAGQGGIPGYTVIEHWNGTSWKLVTSANPGNQFDYLRAVSANPTNANDVWAVGYYNGGYTLVEHWNGTAWGVVSSPHPSAGSNNLYGVTTISSTDAWAVGYKDSSNGTVPLAIHWNGTSWAENSPSSPLGGTDVHLQGVTAINSNDVWAVGYYTSGTGRSTATYHFQNGAWQYVSSPNPDTGDEFNAVATAVGYTWAVGEPTSHTDTLTERLVSTGWVVVASPPGGSFNNFLNGVTVTPGTASPDVWAVGWYSNGGGNQTLIENYHFQAGQMPPP